MFKQRPTRGLVIKIGTVELMAILIAVIVYFGPLGSGLRDALAQLSDGQASKSETAAPTANESR
jgi:hypothetical protein